MMEVKAEIKKNEVDLSVLIWKCFKDEKASCRIYCRIPSALTKCMYTQILVQYFPLEDKKLTEVAIDLRGTILRGRLPQWLSGKESTCNAGDSG